MPDASARQDRRIALAAEDIHHVGVGLHLAGHDLGEDSRRAAGNQRDTLLIHLHRLMLVAGLDIPEHHLGQTVTVPGKQLLCVLKVAERSIAHAAVELHVRNNVQHGGKLLLRQAVLHRRMQDQLIDCGAIEFIFKDGRRMNLHTRTIPNCWGMFQANVQGTKGCAQVGEGVGDPAIYEGTEMRDVRNRKVLWKPESESNDSYQTEHDLLFKAIRENKPWNEVQYAIDATRTAILGRTAMETGDYVTMDDVMNSTRELVPNIDDLRLDSPSPAKRDQNGNYEIGEPGVTKLV